MTQATVERTGVAGLNLNKQFQIACNGNVILSKEVNMAWYMFKK